MILTALAWASFGFVVAFTVRACYARPGAGQTPREAIVEAWINIVIGFTFNYAANFALLPLVDARLTAGNTFALGWIFTAVSIVRQYAVRRWFNSRAVAARITGGR